MRMKSGEYYISCSEKDVGKYVRKVSGWIIRDDENKMDFGARWVAHKMWEVTELSTGLLVSAPYNRPADKADIIPFIKRTRSAIVQLMEHWSSNEVYNDVKEMIRKAYEEDKEIET